MVLMDIRVFFIDVLVGALRGLSPQACEVPTAKTSEMVSTDGRGGQRPAMCSDHGCCSGQG